MKWVQCACFLDAPRDIKNKITTGMRRFISHFGTGALWCERSGGEKKGVNMHCERAREGGGANQYGCFLLKECACYRRGYFYPFAILCVGTSPPRNRCFPNSPHGGGGGVWGDSEEWGQCNSSMEGKAPILAHRGTYEEKEGISLLS